MENVAYNVACCYKTAVTAVAADITIDGNIAMTIIQCAVSQHQPTMLAAR